MRGSVDTVRSLCVDVGVLRRQGKCERARDTNCWESGQMGVDFWVGDSQLLDESMGLITPVSEDLRSLLTMF